MSGRKWSDSLGEVGVVVRLFLGQATGRGQEKPARLPAARTRLKVYVARVGSRDQGCRLASPGHEWVGWLGGQRGTNHLVTNSSASPSGKPNSRLPLDPPTPRPRPKHPMQPSSTKSLAPGHQIYRLLRPTQEQATSEQNGHALLAPLRLRHRWRTSPRPPPPAPPPEKGSHLRLSPGYEPMHGSRHLSMAEAWRAGFWENSSPGRGLEPPPTRTQAWAELALSPRLLGLAVGVVSGVWVSCLQESEASGLSWMAFWRMRTDLYSWPLNNTGSNCAGPLMRRSPPSPINTVSIPIHRLCVRSSTNLGRRPSIERLTLANHELKIC